MRITLERLLAEREALAAGKPAQVPASARNGFTVTPTSIGGSLSAWRRLLPAKG